MFQTFTENISLKVFPYTSKDKNTDSGFYTYHTDTFDPENEKHSTQTEAVSRRVKRDDADDDDYDDADDDSNQENDDDNDDLLNALARYRRWLDVKENSVKSANEADEQKRYRRQADKHHNNMEMNEDLDETSSDLISIHEYHEYIRRKRSIQPTSAKPTEQKIDNDKNAFLKKDYSWLELVPPLFKKRSLTDDMQEKTAEFNDGMAPIADEDKNESGGRHVRSNSDVAMEELEEDPNSGKL